MSYKKYGAIICLIKNMVQVLQEEHGTENIGQNGVKLLLATLTKMLDSLQDAYKGQLFSPHSLRHC